MKRIGIMIYPEILDSLESLSNEEIGRMFRLIIKWNKGEVVEPTDSLEKFVWSTIHPKLEENKEKYLETCEKRREAVNKRWSKKEDTNVYNSIQKNTNSNYNSNSNINSSKEEFIINGKQHSSPEGDDVVSKGLEKLESIFPKKKNYIDIDTINLWNSFTQEEKQLLIKKATLYVREELKNNDGTYIKQLSKWLNEQKEKGFDIKPKTLKNKTSNEDYRLFQYTNGGIYLKILDLVGGSTSSADSIYREHNRKDMYKDADEMMKGIIEGLKKQI